MVPVVVVGASSGPGFKGWFSIISPGSRSLAIIAHLLSTAPRPGAERNASAAALPLQGGCTWRGDLGAKREERRRTRSRPESIQHRKRREKANRSVYEFTWSAYEANRRNYGCHCGTLVLKETEYANDSAIAFRPELNSEDSRTRRENLATRDRRERTRTTKGSSADRQRISICNYWTYRGGRRDTSRSLFRQGLNGFSGSPLKSVRNGDRRGPWRLRIGQHFRQTNTDALVGCTAENLTK